MQKITIGKIVNAVGLKGEVRIYSYSDRKERFEELESLILTGKNGDRTYQVENIRYQKNMVIAKLAGVDDRNGAEALKDHDVNITESQLPDLEEDTFFIKDLIGCSVADEAGGRVFGVIEDVIQKRSGHLCDQTGTGRPGNDTGSRAVRARGGHKEKDRDHKSDTGPSAG